MRTAMLSMSRWRPPDIMEGRRYSSASSSSLLSWWWCWRPRPGRSCLRPQDSYRYLWQPFVLALLLFGLEIIPGTLAASPVSRLPSCKSTDENEITFECTSMQADLIPHMLDPSLRVLKVTNSRISSLSNIDVYIRMRYLDLSGNSLAALGGPLSRLDQLKVLIVRENKLPALRRSDLAGLRSLTRLDVARNQIASIEERTFVNTSLVELDLSQNRLRQFTKAMLQGLERLQWLSLRDNEFLAVPFSLRTLRGLQFLDLSFNVLGDISGEQLPEVKTLLLERCDVSDTSFLSPKSTITHLDLSSNRFVAVPRPLPANLEVLILDANPIQTLPARSLAHVPKLQNFSLSTCNELRLVHIDAFAPNRELRQIVLESDVTLQTLDSRTFRSLGKLEALSLRESGLRTLEAGYVSWDRLKRLDLRDNPFRCDCSLSWLRDMANAYLNSTRLPLQNRPRPLDESTVHISCAQPQQFAGRKLYELPASAFKCSSASWLLLVGVPLLVVAVLAGGIVAGLVYWRRRSRQLPAWLPCLRGSDKTAPTNSNTKQQFLEKTYMVPGDDYDGIYHAQCGAPVRLIPVTEL